MPELSLMDALSKAVEIFVSHEAHDINAKRQFDGESIPPADLEAGDIDSVMSRGLFPIAEATNLDRITIFHYFNQDNGKGYLGHRYLWVKDKGGMRPPHEHLQKLPDTPVIKNWVEMFLRGEHINSPVKSLNKGERDFLESYGIKSLAIIPVFIGGSFWGMVCYQDHNDSDRYFTDEEIKFFFTASRMCVNTMLRAETEEKAGIAHSKLAHRERLMASLVKATSIFLSQSQEKFEDIMTSGVYIIANIGDIDRFSIWRNFERVDGLYSEQIYRWDRKAGGTFRPEDYVFNKPVRYSDFAPRWESVFKRGDSINSPIKLLPERKSLQRFEMLSAYVTPLYFKDALWGFGLFEDHFNERFFDDDTAEMMRLAAFLCANTVIRAEMEKDLKTSNKNLKIQLEQKETISDILNGFVSEGDSEKLINEALLKLGYHKNVSLVVVFELDYDNEKIKTPYYWSEDGLPPRFSDVNLFDFIQSTFKDNLYGANIAYCSDSGEVDTPEHAEFFKVGLRALVAAPLYIEGKLWGVISIANYDECREWTESEIEFISVTANAVSGAIMRDIYTKQLKSAYQKVVEASRAKSEFLSNMSHEIRTPMNAIIGMTEIGKQSGDTEKKHYALEKIDDASKHLLGVINDVLDMSKIEANKFELSDVNFVFEDMLRRVVNFINFRVDKKRQNLYISIDSGIPHVLIGDDHRLAQVISNLLSNAVKFTPEGGTIRIEANLLSSKDDEHQLQISVTDTGIGITDEQCTRLFNSFEQAEKGTARKYGGTGLGLSISKRIVELMGGEIWVESKFNKGSKFIFNVTLKRGVSPHSHRLSPDINWKNIRIFAIDDDPIICEFFESVSKGIGITCHIAQSAEEARELLAQNCEYDVFFVDWNLPGINGIELAEYIRGETDGKSIVAMFSSSDWSLIESDARGAGVDEFLPKPLLPSSIVDLINNCLSCDNKEEATKNPVFTNFAGKKILLAEDVEINREIVKELLEPYNLTLEFAEDGKQAVSMFKDNYDKYDMIFMDVHMPEMDGYEATREIRALDVPNADSIPIVAMTANVFHEDVEHCLSSGMNDHVGKPINISDVLSKLKKYLPN